MKKKEKLSDVGMNRKKATLLPYGIAVLLLVFTLMSIGGRTEAAEGVGGKTTVLELMRYGGSLMYPIYLCSVIALAFIFERAINLRHSRVVPVDFITDNNGCRYSLYGP